MVPMPPSRGRPGSGKGKPNPSPSAKSQNTSKVTKRKLPAKKATASKPKPKPKSKSKSKPRPTPKAKSTNNNSNKTNGNISSLSKKSGEKDVEELANVVKHLTCGNCGTQVVAADNRDSDVNLFSPNQMVQITAGSNSKAIYNVHLPIFASHSVYFASFLSNSLRETGGFSDTTNHKSYAYGGF